MLTAAENKSKQSDSRVNMSDGQQAKVNFLFYIRQEIMMGFDDLIINN